MNSVQTLRSCAVSGWNGTLCRRDRHRGHLVSGHSASKQESMKGFKPSRFKRFQKTSSGICIRSQSEASSIRKYQVLWRSKGRWFPKLLYGMWRIIGLSKHPLSLSVHHNDLRSFNPVSTKNQVYIGDVLHQIALKVSANWSKRFISQTKECTGSNEQRLYSHVPCPVPSIWPVTALSRSLDCTYTELFNLKWSQVDGSSRVSVRPVQRISSWKRNGRACLDHGLIVSRNCGFW